MAKAKKVVEASGSEASSATAKKPMTDGTKALLGMLGGIALACAVFFGFTAASHLMPKPVTLVQHDPVPTQPEVVDQTPPPLEDTETGKDDTPERLKKAQEQFAGFKLLERQGTSGFVHWQTPEATSDFGFHGVSSDGCSGVHGIQIKLGTFVGGDLIGKDLYMITVEECGMGTYISPVYVALDTQARVAHVLTRYSYNEAILFPEGVIPDGQTGVVTKAFAAGGYTVVPDDQQLSELEYPDTVSLDKPAVTFHKAYMPFSEGDLEWRSYDATERAAFVHPVFGPAYAEQNGGFVFLGPEGLVHRYAMDIPFQQTVEGFTQFNIVLNGGSPLHGDYSAASLGGCGASDFLHINEVPMARLHTVGKTSTGDPIYEVSADDPLMLKAYETVFVPPEKTKPTFEVFVKSHPFFFWIDPFNRMVEFDDSTSKRYVECGKPVIYLYPEKTMDVSVRVAPNGGFTYTDPAYGNGWEVTAQPNGRLTERATGRDYPYLFWEGRSQDLWNAPSSGFVVAQDEVSGFLDAKLAALGLNAQETADFKEFWLPRFSGHPYYLVSFAGNRLMDRIAPLSVSPQPDTVIRVLMDFVGLEAPVTVPPQVLKAPERRGFTVVEWGGVIR